MAAASIDRGVGPRAFRRCERIAASRSSIESRMGRPGHVAMKAHAPAECASSTHRWGWSGQEAHRRGQRRRVRLGGCTTGGVAAIARAFIPRGPWGLRYATTAGRACVAVARAAPVPRAGHRHGLLALVEDLGGRLQVEERASPLRWPREALGGPAELARTANVRVAVRHRVHVVTGEEPVIDGEEVVPPVDPLEVGGNSTGTGGRRRGLVGAGTASGLGFPCRRRRRPSAATNSWTSRRPRRARPSPFGLCVAGFPSRPC